MTSNNMAAAGFRLARLEGGVSLAQDDEGHLRLQGGPPRYFERLLLGRPVQDAVYLTQQISADSGVSHALAALAAWEDAGSLPVAENGIALRELLHACSLLHAHLRQFYYQALPDYLPFASLSAYDGSFPELLRMQQGIAGKDAGHWTQQRFEHPFAAQELGRLWEHRVQALRALEQMQRMMALVGGKFPMVMSLVPGGVNLSLSEAAVLRLRALLGTVRAHLEGMVPGDGLLLLQRYPELKTIGRGSADYLCAGSGKEASAVEGAMFPSGVLLGGGLEPFAAVATESIHSAHYRIPDQAAAQGALTVPAPEKPGAYSWIKAPRYYQRPMETGSIARLVITNLSGAHIGSPDFADQLELLLGVPLADGNTVGGRILARLGEMQGLMERAETLLDKLDPAHPTVAPEGEPFAVSGEGLGLVEAPAGALQHRMVLEKGRIVHYDIVSPSTWNGSPLDERGETGSLETALNRSAYDLSLPAHERTLSRIVHSFAFSMTDAVH